MLNVQLEFDVTEFAFRIPVLIEIKPRRVRFIGGAYEELEKTTPSERLIEQGLRAQLKPGNLLTGQLYIALGFFGDKPEDKVEIETQDGHPIIPTVTSPPLEAIANQVAAFMDTLNALPLQEIGNDLRDTVKGAKDIATSKALT